MKSILNTITFIFLIFTFSLPCFSQVNLQGNGNGVLFFQDLNSQEESGKKLEPLVQYHYLGTSTAELLNQFENTYTVKEQVMVGSYATEKRVPLKPYLYNAIHKLERYYVKSVKRDRVDYITAASKLNKYLQLAILASKTNTRTIELQLKDAKNNIVKIESILDKLDPK